MYSKKEKMKGYPVLLIIVGCSKHLEGIEKIAVLIEYNFCDEYPQLRCHLWFLELEEDQNYAKSG